MKITLLKEVSPVADPLYIGMSDEKRHFYVYMYLFALHHHYDQFYFTMTFLVVPSLIFRMFIPL